MRFVWVYVCAALTLGGCSVARDDGTGTAALGAGHAPEEARCQSYGLWWGSGAGQVGLLPPAEERIAQGAPAMAVAPSGDLYLLDAVNRRVLALDREGNASTFAEVPRDAADIAVGPDGAVAAFSPLRSEAWIFAPDGAPAGDLHIPRAVRSITGVSLTSSRRIRVHNAFQDTFTAGSPAMPLDVPSMLRSKSEGALLLADGRGVKARALGGGVAEVVVVRKQRGAGEARHAEQRFPVPRRADALQVAGVSGQIACFRLEEVDLEAATVAVQRRALCMDLTNGEVVFDTPLPAPGVYVPRHELAVGGTPPTVAWLAPTASGLGIEKCEVQP
jgi:hypothetical protein